ncbi:Rop family plasmid primer RNA-binding protein (plasmid) [Enterobacter hormaechei]
MTRQESAALNMAKYIRAQTLLLLERLEQKDLDEAAGCCEQLHDQAEALFALLNAHIG